MRKERLIVPTVVGLAVIWALAQWVASLLFERELSRALKDLEARGEVVMESLEAERGWLSSSGRVRLAPLLGDGWQLEIDYEARHGVLSTRVDGEVQPLYGPRQQRLFGDVLASATPRWQARYQTLGGTLEGGIQLAPFIVQQEKRELEFTGGHLTFGGQYGDWRLRLRLTPWRLSDGPVILEAGPMLLESRYAYTAGAHHFTQHDRLQVEQLSWQQPNLQLELSDLVVRSRMLLDERELRIDGELELGEVQAADQVLLTGRLAMELSRLNGDALRASLAVLRDEAARSRQELSGRDYLARLEPELIAMLQDSPRLDVTEVDLESPMLGLTARGEGALFFDARRLGELSLMRLDEPQERARWLARLDGDFVWRDVPTVVALWLGLPLETRHLEIDVVRGRVRVNGRPLPPLWR